MSKRYLATLCSAILCNAFFCSTSYAADVSEQDIWRPAITNSQWENLATVGEVDYRKRYEISLFSAEHGEDKARLWSQTKSIFGYGFGVIGAIWLMPEEISHWDKEGQVFSKWGDNVSDGPVWDRDVGWINLIGHPYFGGVYYQAARKSGYRQWDSFVYAFLMSTFYWEYGIEAFAETPSVQDLVVTPVLGWIYGEWAFQTERDIRSNGGKVLNSEFLGSTALVLLDPVDSIGRGINSLFSRQLVNAGTGYVQVRDVPIAGGGGMEKQLQLRMQFQLGDGKRFVPYYSADQDYFAASADPVDYSIIGISGGIGHSFLDNKWQVENGPYAEIGLGLYFSPAWSLKLEYGRSRLQERDTDDDVIFEHYGLTGQYYFNSEHALRPFISLGLGEIMRDQDRDRKTFTTQLGGGLYYKLSDKLALQLDVKQYLSTAYNSHDTTSTLSLIYRFGRGEIY